MKRKQAVYYRTSRHSRNILSILAFGVAALASVLSPGRSGAGVYNAPNPMSSAETPAPIVPYIELSIGSSIIGEGGTAYVDASPQMPQLVARLKPNGLSGNVSWSIVVSYSRYRNDTNSYPASGSPKTLPTTTTWNIYDEFGTAFCGGDASISANYNSMALSRSFKIRGYNPTESTVVAYIGGTPWYARPIAKAARSNQNRVYFLKFDAASEDVPRELFEIPFGFRVRTLCPL